MTRKEALEYFKEELKGGKCSDTCPICNAMEWAIKALEEPSRIERELHGKTPEEQLDFLKWFMYEYPRWFTQSQTALIDWLKGEKQ